MAEDEAEQELSESEIEAQLVALAGTVVDEYRRKALPLLAEAEAKRAHFQYLLNAYWDEAFAHYDLSYRLAYDIGHGINERNRAAASSRKDRVFEVLARLHSWALLTASEVRALVTTGHGGGALALSRTAMEQATIATFIQERGQDVADRFLKHGPYEERKRIQEYNKAATALGEKTYDATELARIEKECADLARDYGNNYLGPYGWAANTLFPGRPDSTPNYRHVEEATNIKQIRHYYVLASTRIHAGATGSGAHLYRASWGGGYNTGPSNTRLALPASSTLMALLQCAAAFSTHALKEYGDRQPTAQFMALRRLNQEAVASFNRIEQALATPLAREVETTN